MKNLYLLITIVRRKDAQEYDEFYRAEGVSVVYDILCNGTAHVRTLDLLGIERTEKTMLWAVVTGDTLRRIVRDLTHRMKIDLPDRGVAMAVPLSSVGGAKTLEYYTSEQTFSEEEEQMQSQHELIVAIYEKGYTDLVMNAAREAGARGGTTINAKGTSAYVEKFFGLSLAQEKEIVLIVSSRDKQKDIMKSIMQNAGEGTRAQALVFSLPVSETAGFRFADEVEKD